MTDLPAVPNAQDIQNSLTRSRDFRGLPGDMQMVYYELAAVVVALLAERFDDHATLEGMLKAREQYLLTLQAKDFGANFASCVTTIEFAESYAYVNQRIAEELALVRYQLEHLAEYDALGDTYRDRIVKLMKFDPKKFKRIKASMLSVGDYLNEEAFPFMTIRL